MLAALVSECDDHLASAEREQYRFRDVCPRKLESVLENLDAAVKYDLKRVLPFYTAELLGRAEVSSLTIAAYTPDSYAVAITSVRR